MGKYKIKLFTHTDCDGVGCAILAYLAFGRENVDVEYCDYDNINEKVGEFWGWKNLDEYDHVFITDISIKDELASSINSLDIGRWRLFDHHATALDLNKYGWCTVDTMNHVMNVKTSGTELFYLYLSEHEQFDHLSANTIKNIDRFVDIVRDYDTWRWKEELGEEGVVCKQLNDLFYIYGRDEFIDVTLNRLTKQLDYPNFTLSDITLLKQKQHDIDVYVEEKNKQLFSQLDAFGNEYGVVFAERYFSELGNRLSEMHPEYAYIAMIDISRGKVSYRTVKDNIDVGMEIAHSFGGGGHKKAAGSTFDADDVQETVLRLIFEESGECVDECRMAE